MRSGLATIQQTLTPEASTVLSHSITEAGRRNHSQVTPLHVAATLLASPSSFLRQACIRSHPNSSHPLQCRALELCFSVALDRLPMTQTGSDSVEPPISNALMAALKRAQAHQRRGCPEQQQQPLLAVKVELEQLIISILDDPSVSRVMREASFSSPAVKASIEKSINSSSNGLSSSDNSLSFRPRNNHMYLNPRLQLGQQNAAPNIHFGQQYNHKVDEVFRVLEIMARNNKRNPILVGDSELESISTQLFAKFKNNDMNGTFPQNVQLVQFEKELVSDKSQLPRKINDLGDSIEDHCNRCGGVILNLGDLKWLVEQNGSSPAQPAAICEIGRLAVEEIRKLLRRFGNRLWIIGMATCETYLRCQVYHNTIESDWDLQAVSVMAKAPLPLCNAFPRIGMTGFLGNSMQSLASSIGSFAGPLSENLDHVSKMTCCARCRESYEKELGAVMPGEITAEAGKPLLPTWLQSAKSTDQTLQGNEFEKGRNQKIAELMRKWNEKCLQLHGTLNHVLGTERILTPSTPSVSALLNPKFLNPKLVEAQQQRSFVEMTLRLNPTLALEKDGPSTPRSPVRTELVLGRSASPEKIQTSYNQQNVASMEMQANKLLSSLLDADWLKKLMKTLMDRVWWQREAASAVATAIAQCKLGNGQRRGAASKGTIWLLFTGPDRVGKMKMASALSEVLCGLGPVVIPFNSRRSSDNTNQSFRGKTALDRIGEAVKRNPFSVVVLEDIDDADMLIRGNLKRAMETGRIVDSHGRELSLGNVTFVLTSNYRPEELKLSSSDTLGNDLMAGAAENWQLKFTISDRKRRPDWTSNEGRRTRPRKDSNSPKSFDLNEALDTDDEDRANGSGNSSDLTAEPEIESARTKHAVNPTTAEFLTHIDSAIAFEPADFSAIRQRLVSAITTSFSSIIRNELEASLRVEEAALKKILGGIWLGQSSLEEWVEDVLVPSFQKVKEELNCQKTERPAVVQLEIDDGSTPPDHRNA